MINVAQQVRGAGRGFAGPLCAGRRCPGVVLSGGWGWGQGAGMVLAVVSQMLPVQVLPVPAGS